MNMNDFIFSNKLKCELQFLLDNPTKLPGSLCLYGNPGNGKTSFANYLAHEIGAEVQYFDANSFKIDRTSSNSVLQSINDSFRTISLNQFIKGNEHLRMKPYDRVFIIDEFHNSTEQTQDSYKVAVEEISKKDCIFIFILNTDLNDKHGSYEKRVTPAMRSRFYSIDFDVKEIQVDEVCKQVQIKYPKVPDELVRNLVRESDFRQLTMRAKMIG